jgi:hypothetical protein
LKLQTRARMFDSGLHAALARNSPFEATIATVSPARAEPMMLAMAPEKTQG